VSGSAPPHGPGGSRAELIDHLEYLRELGVREIRDGSRTLRTSAKSPARGSVPSRHSPGEPAGATPRPRSGRAEERGSKEATLERLRRDEIGDCKRCRLCESRTHVVFGVGDAAARLMFVGEGPGRDEDKQGIPFVGRAGQLLTDIIQAMKLTREQVYIANIVKCRPPENRTPEPDEIASCRGFVEKQIEIISPAVIVCLGAVATNTLLGTSMGITKIRGQLREFRGVPVMPTYHPAYLLRSPQKKRDVWQDMKKVMALLAGEP
jgi:DNA polymerase